MKLRNASPDEVERLNQFIRDSKSIWGYSKSFLDKYIDHWGLTPEIIEQRPIKILEADGEVNGIFRVGKHKKKIELDLFFVNNKLIRMGIGRKMWILTDEYVRAHKWKGFEIITDPHAEKFFERMGAKTIGKKDFPPERKAVPVMLYELTPTRQSESLVSSSSSETSGG